MFSSINPNISRKNDAAAVFKKKVVAIFSEQVRKNVERTIGPSGHIDAAPSEIGVTPKHRRVRPCPKAPDCSIDEIGAVLRSIRSHT